MDREGTTRNAGAFGSCYFISASSRKPSFLFPLAGKPLTLYSVTWWGMVGVQLSSAKTLGDLHITHTG